MDLSFRIAVASLTAGFHSNNSAPVDSTDGRLQKVVCPGVLLIIARSES